MSFPTISLCLIAKNEEKNLPRLFKSIEGCFDEVILVDTGSTDKTVELATEFGAKVHHFKWINDFSAARNFALSHASMDYVAWLDCDDALLNKDAFIHWKKTAMEFADCWLAAYNYALDADGKPLISFVRERVFRRSLDPQFHFPIHEGIIMKPEWTKDYAITWSVDHHRSLDDVKADKNRNVTILEALKKEGKLDARLQFYYGKELYEASRNIEALKEFELAAKTQGLEHHDRLLTYQYGAYAAMGIGDSLNDPQEKIRYYTQAIDFCHDGIKMDSNRAEYHVAAGDIYLKMGDMLKALPYYAAAKACYNPKSNGSPYEGAVYSFVDCYGLLPSLQLAKIWLNIGKIEDATKEAQECVTKYNSAEAKAVLDEINRISHLVKIDNNQTDTEDILISCPPHQAYPFDEEIYKTKPLGGSETALVSMAKELKELTGRNVKVYNSRESDLVAESGVEYLSNKNLNEYLSKYRPKVHIAWRHNIEVTKAKTYLWCHDLVTPSVESKQNFHKIICLSEFHKNYVMAKQGVNPDKIWVSRNGIPVDKIKQAEKKVKNPNKLLWMSSPDRGLDRAILVCDEVRKEYPDIELHVYYGLENLRKYGLVDLANKIDAMMVERPWVKYHGFTEQSKMFSEVSDGSIWIHPCNFIETFCITALEMLALKVFPVTRKLGALANTLAEAESKGMAILHDFDCNSPEAVLKYAESVKKVLNEKAWERVSLDIDKHSWRSIAKEWVKEMEL